MSAAQMQTKPMIAETDRDWRAKAACADFDPDIFFDRAAENPDIAEMAKEVCAGCSMIQNCLNAAMLNNEKYGIWGGMDPDERQKHRRAWERSQGGRGVVRTIRQTSGIFIHDPSIERRYAARLAAARECRARAVESGNFPRRDEFLAVLEMIISHPMDDGKRLAARMGISKTWFNTMKREVYRKFDVKEIYEGGAA